MTPGGPIEVDAARDLAAARFLSDLLADAGVEATVFGEPPGAAVGELPPLDAAPRVWVRASEAEKARPVIAEYHRRLVQRAAGRGHRGTGRGTILLPLRSGGRPGPIPVSGVWQGTRLGDLTRVPSCARRD